MCQMCFFQFFLLPDLCQIVARLLPDWGDPRARFSSCTRFLDFQKNLARGTGTPCQILATISRLPDCARLWCRIPTWLLREPKTQGIKKKKTPPPPSIPVVALAAVAACSNCHPRHHCHRRCCRSLSRQRRRRRRSRRCCCHRFCRHCRWLLLLLMCRPCHRRRCRRLLSPSPSPSPLPLDFCHMSLLE